VLLSCNFLCLFRLQTVKKEKAATEGELLALQKLYDLKLEETEKKTGNTGPKTDKETEQEEFVTYLLEENKDLQTKKEAAEEENELLQQEVAALSDELAQAHQAFQQSEVGCPLLPFCRFCFCFSLYRNIHLAL
jgi:hypothetical protein